MTKTDNYQYQKFSIRQLSIIVLIAFIIAIVLVMLILNKNSSRKQNYAQETSAINLNAIQSSKIIKKKSTASNAASDNNSLRSNFEKTGEMTINAK